jgi:hypothetical protein
LTNLSGQSYNAASLESASAFQFFTPKEQVHVGEDLPSEICCGCLFHQRSPVVSQSRLEIGFGAL